VQVTERYAHAVGTLAERAAKETIEASRMPSFANDKPATSPQRRSLEVAQAREIVLTHFRQFEDRPMSSFDHLRHVASRKTPFVVPKIAHHVSILVA